MDLIDDMLAKHSDDEIIAYLYSLLSSTNKSFNDAIMDENRVLMGSCYPNYSQAATILQKLKRRNDERQARMDMIQ